MQPVGRTKRCMELQEGNGGLTLLVRQAQTRDGSDQGHRGVPSRWKEGLKSYGSVISYDDEEAKAELEMRRRGRSVVDLAGTLLIADDSIRCCVDQEACRARATAQLGKRRSIDPGGGGGTMSIGYPFLSASLIANIDTDIALREETRALTIQAIHSRSMKGATSRRRNIIVCIAFAAPTINRSLPCPAEGYAATVQTRPYHSILARRLISCEAFF